MYKIVGSLKVTCARCVLTEKIYSLHHRQRFTFTATDIKVFEYQLWIAATAVSLAVAPLPAGLFAFSVTAILWTATPPITTNTRTTCTDIFIWLNLSCNQEIIIDQAQNYIDWMQFRVKVSLTQILQLLILLWILHNEFIIDHLLSNLDEKFTETAEYCVNERRMPYNVDNYNQILHDHKMCHLNLPNFACLKTLNL